MFSKFYRKDYLILMKATKILIIYSLIFILLNSTIVLAEQRNGIYEPLDYLNDNTPLSIAIPSSNAWKTEIAASEINSEWNDNDEFSIVNFDNADMSFDNNNVLTMTFNNVDYENGNLVVLLFRNETKDEYSALQIDFSETGIPTFQSEFPFRKSRRRLRQQYKRQKRASAVFSFLFISDKSAGSVGVRG